MFSGSRTGMNLLPLAGCVLLGLPSRRQGLALFHERRAARLQRRRRLSCRLPQLVRSFLPNDVGTKFGNSITGARLNSGALSHLDSLFTVVLQHSSMRLSHPLAPLSPKRIVGLDLRHPCGHCQCNDELKSSYNQFYIHPTKNIPIKQLHQVLSIHILFISTIHVHPIHILFISSSYP